MNNGANLLHAERDPAALVTEVQRLDHEIARLDARQAELPDLMQQVQRHPALWLVLGREGIDRPGGLATSLPQQVVVPTAPPWRTWVLVGGLGLLVGMVIGGGSVLLLGGGL